MAELKGSAKLGQYLKGLRQGYGYSLRKVEEKAPVHGGDIDNSQLSRYEKGICYPSFDKLRTLGRIFNVSIQTFSDVVDLEELERTQPAGDDAELLLETGRREYERGDFGRAYAHFQKARVLLEKSAGENGAPTAIARARASAALALIRMGKYSLAEYELRQLLRNDLQLDPRTITSALLQLCAVHRFFGDLVLAELEARRALELAEDAGDVERMAHAHHELGVIQHRRGAPDDAVVHLHEALARFRGVGQLYDALVVKQLLGVIYAERGQFQEGVRMLYEVRDEARKLGDRRRVAQCGAWLAEILFRRGDYAGARQAMRESNAIASGGEVHYLDTLFLNAFYLWRIALAENNAAEARIAFGRLKTLRPQLEVDLPEIRSFDQFVEKGGAQ